MEQIEKIIETFGYEETFELGKVIGEHVKAGMILCLDGDLGVGKTVFTQGFAKGLGITESVNSPTFTIVQEYDCGRMPLYHFESMGHHGLYTITKVLCHLAVMGDKQV